MNSLGKVFGDLPLPAIVALCALGIVQLSLQIFSLSDLARRPVVAGGRKWVWVIVIVLGGLIGAFAYLAAGRAAPRLAGDAEAQASSEEARRRALDKLYGPDRRA